MRIILNEDIPSLGEEGDICVVADGYARNYLIPLKKALLYTKENANIFKQKSAAIERRKEEKRRAALSLKEKLASETVTFKIASGDKGRLFGSVTNAMIVEELSKSGIQIERKKVDIPGHTIKSVGEFTIGIKLYGEEEAALKVIVEGVPQKGAEKDSNEGTEEKNGSSADAGAESNNDGNENKDKDKVSNTTETVDDEEVSQTEESSEESPAEGDGQEE